MPVSPIKATFPSHWAVQSSNKMLEGGSDALVAPPDPELVVALKGDPTLLYNRIAELQSPNERLLLLLKSTFHPTEEPTHEAHAIRSLFVVGAFAGLFYGGLFRSPDAHQEYIRNHNASVFDNQYAKRRHFFDTLVNTIFRRGTGFAFKTALLTSSAGLIGYGSIAYRDKLYLPDWMVGFGTMGALSRLWLGSRAVAAGALIGLTGGLVGFGMARSMELISGVTATQMRHLNHAHWSQRMDGKMRLAQIIQEKETLEYVDGVKDGIPRLT